MADASSGDVLAAISLFLLVPGFLAVTVTSILTGEPRRREPALAAVEAALGSAVSFLGPYGVWTLVFHRDPISASWPDRFAFFAAAVLSALFVGYLFARILVRFDVRDISRAFQQKFGRSERPVRANEPVWDQYMERMQEAPRGELGTGPFRRELEVKLRDGTVFQGFLDHYDDHADGHDLELVHVRCIWRAGESRTEHDEIDRVFISGTEITYCIDLRPTAPLPNTHPNLIVRAVVRIIESSVPRAADFVTPAPPIRVSPTESTEKQVLAQD